MWAKGLLRSVPDLKTMWVCIIGREYFNKAQIDKCCKALLKMQRHITPSMSKEAGWVIVGGRTK